MWDDVQEAFRPVLGTGSRITGTIESYLWEPGLGHISSLTEEYSTRKETEALPFFRNSIARMFSRPLSLNSWETRRRGYTLGQNTKTSDVSSQHHFSLCEFIETQFIHLSFLCLEEHMCGSGIFFNQSVQSHSDSQKLSSLSFEKFCSFLWYPFPLFSLPVPWIHSLFGFSCNTFALFYFLPGIICLLKRNMKKLKNTFLSSNFIVLACLIFISSSSFRTEFQIFLIHGDSVLSQKYFLQIPWQLSVPDNIAMVYRMWILGRMFLPYKTANL